MKPELDNQSVHRYMRVYNYYKQLILSQQLAPGSRLPSIRRCAAELQMSRTTVETAYEIPSCDWSSDVCSSDLKVKCLFLQEKTDF